MQNAGSSQIQARLDRRGRTRQAASARSENECRAVPLASAHDTAPRGTATRVRLRSSAQRSAWAHWCRSEPNP